VLGYLEDNDAVSQVKLFFSTVWLSENLLRYFQARTLRSGLSILNVGYNDALIVFVAL